MADDDDDAIDPKLNDMNLRRLESSGDVNCFVQTGKAVSLLRMFSTDVIVLSPSDWLLDNPGIYFHDVNELVALSSGA